ncbi:MAG: cysteine desulfurase NifS [Candidatus Omnitrophica bacterium]|nr:cysteine desulfurase NifS [Candidatus Omnitrophota bacterium]
MKRIYLDYAATTPTDPKVVEAMKPFFSERFGNPSSLHSFGQEAKQAIEEARSTLAQSLGAKPEEIIFTSGGTESDNMALFGVVEAKKDKGNHIIVSAIEHHAVHEPAKLLEKRDTNVTYIPVDKGGLVNPEDVKKAIRPETILISIMHANNEIGTVQPISEIGSIAKAKGITFHSDAVQTVGHIPINVDELNVDLLSLSAHKFYGPKGVGALYVRKGTRIGRFLHGGDQEKGKRSSTHNTTGIVGLGAAVRLCQQNLAREEKEQIALRDKLIKGIQDKIPDCLLNGHVTKRLPNNVNFSFKYVEGESIILNLDMLGIAVSTGSACTSSNLEASHVLLAIGLSHELAHGSLRFTLGRWTKEEEIDYCLEQLSPVIEKLRQMSPLYPGK